MTKQTVCPACESAAKVCEEQARRLVASETDTGAGESWLRHAAHAIRAACTHAQPDAEREALAMELLERHTLSEWDDEINGVTIRRRECRGCSNIASLTIPWPCDARRAADMLVKESR